MITREQALAASRKLREHIPLSQAYMGIADYGPDRDCSVVVYFKDKLPTGGLPTSVDGVQITYRDNCGEIRLCSATLPENC